MILCVHSTSLGSLLSGSASSRACPSSTLSCLSCCSGKSWWLWKQNSPPPPSLIPVTRVSNGVVDAQTWYRQRDQPNNQETMSPIELFWTAKTIWGDAANPCKMILNYGELMPNLWGNEAKCPEELPQRQCEYIPGTEVIFNRYNIHMFDVLKVWECESVQKCPKVHKL